MSNANKIVVGGSGSGKTYLTKHLVIEKLRKAGIPVCIFDSKGYDYQDVADVEIQPEKFLDAFQAGAQVVRWDSTYQPAKTDELGEVCDRFLQGCDKVLQKADYVVVVIDEAHNLMRPSKVYSRQLERIQKEGRGYGLSTVLISQEPVDFKKSIINNAGEFFIFRVSQIHDKISEKLDVPEDQIANLPDRHYFHSKDGGATKRFEPL